MTTRTHLSATQFNNYSQPQSKNQILQNDLCQPVPSLSKSHGFSQSNKFTSHKRILSYNTGFNKFKANSMHTCTQYHELLKKYSQQSQKLVDQRAQLLQRNFQFYKKLRLCISSKDQVSPVSVKNHKRNRFQYNCSKTLADENQQQQQKSPQFYTPKPVAKQQIGSSTKRIFLKRCLNQKQQINYSKLFSQSPNTKVTEPKTNLQLSIIVKRQNNNHQKTSDSIQFKTKETSLSIQNDRNKNEKRKIKKFQENSSMNRKLMNRHERTNSTSINKSPNRNMKTLDLKIKKLKQQNKKLKTKYLL